MDHSTHRSYSHKTGDGERIFAPVFANVWENSLRGLSDGSVKVYVALLMHTTVRDRTRFLSIEEMATDAGVSVSTAKRAKDELIKAGLINQRWRVKDDDGEFRVVDHRPPPKKKAIQSEHPKYNIVHNHQENKEWSES